MVIDYENVFTPLDSEHLKIEGRSPQKSAKKKSQLNRNAHITQKL
jgi:hypothetical protein